MGLLVADQRPEVTSDAMVMALEVVDMVAALNMVEAQALAMERLLITVLDMALVLTARVLAVLILHRTSTTRTVVLTADLRGPLAMEHLHQRPLATVDHLHLVMALAVLLEIMGEVDLLMVVMEAHLHQVHPMLKMALLDRTEAVVVVLRSASTTVAAPPLLVLELAPATKALAMAPAASTTPATLGTHWLVHRQSITHGTIRTRAECERILRSELASDACCRFLSCRVWFSWTFDVAVACVVVVVVFLFVRLDELSTRPSPRVVVVLRVLLHHF